jgi:hypothetical protein
MPGRDLGFLARREDFGCPLGSNLPDDLQGLGHDVIETGDGERILPAGITAMVITEGSTVPIAVTHAGIARSNDTPSAWA